MTRDTDILGALRFEPMTAAEIGRGFAPDHIKDRAAWGRKWVAKNEAFLIPTKNGWTVPVLPEGPMEFPYGKIGKPEPTYTGTDFTAAPEATGFLNRAQELLQSWFVGASGLLDPHRYRAPHAPRGTPPRPHHPHKYRPRLLKGHI